MPEPPAQPRHTATSAWVVHDQALAVLDRHLPGAQGCVRCRRPWPCDASRLAAALIDLLPALLRAPVAPGATAGTAVDAGPSPPVADDAGAAPAGAEPALPMQRWRSARSSVQAAYEAVRGLLPGVGADRLPSAQRAHLVDLQHRALLDLACAEQELDDTRPLLDALAR